MLATSIRRILGVASACAALASFNATASATTYYFTASGSANTPAEAAPGYGSADVTTVGADLKFVIALAPGWFVDTGTHDAIEFKLSTSGLTISGSSGAVTALTVPFFQDTSASTFTNPGFNAPVNYAILCGVGGGNGANSCNGISSLTFYVLGAGGLQPLLTTDGVYITADIYNPDSTTGENTGTVGATLGTSVTPLPAAAWLFGSVLLGAAGASRFRRGQKRTR